MSLLGRVCGGLWIRSLERDEMKNRVFNQMDPGGEGFFLQPFQMDV